MTRPPGPLKGFANIFQPGLLIPGSVERHSVRAKARPPPVMEFSSGQGPRHGIFTLQRAKTNCLVQFFVVIITETTGE
jgi:hypothetical protein